MKKFTETLAVILLLLMALPTTTNAVGRESAVLIDDEGFEIGVAEFWNSRDNFYMQLQAEGAWLISDVQIYIGSEPPPTKKDRPVPGQFPCVRASVLNDIVAVACRAEIFMLGAYYVAAHGDLVIMNEIGEITTTSDFWVYYEPTAEPFLGLNHGWYFTHEWFHP